MVPAPPGRCSTRRSEPGGRAKVENSGVHPPVSSPRANAPLLSSHHRRIVTSVVLYTVVRKRHAAVSSLPTYLGGALMLRVAHATRSQRQFGACLFRHHVRGVPGRPVRVSLPCALLM